MSVFFSEQVVDPIIASDTVLVPVQESVSRRVFGECVLCIQPGGEVFARFNLHFLTDKQYDKNGKTHSYYDSECYICLFEVLFHIFKSTTKAAALVLDSTRVILPVTVQSSVSEFP